jgi:hypothetical protein
MEPALLSLVKKIEEGVAAEGEVATERADGTPRGGEGIEGANADPDRI